jgi:uncharacterized protein RhaS with RHS repeats
VSEDPIGLSGGPNLYTYVSNRPVDYVDPLGLDAFVTVYDSTKQPFGHTGLGIDTTATVGFHPVESAGTSDILLRRPVPRTGPRRAGPVLAVGEGRAPGP